MGTFFDVALFVLATLMLLIGMISLPFRSRRDAGSWFIVGGIIILFVSALLMSFGADEAARELGFRSANEQEKAKASGFNDSASWQAELNRIAEDESRKGREKAEADRQSQEKLVAEAEAERRRCLEDVSCIGEKLHINATMSCRKYVENLAKNDFQWIDGWTESKFSRFKFKNIHMETIIYIGDKIKYQNGLGNWIRHVYECDFNIDKKEVEGVRVRPGRFPN